MESQQKQNGLVACGTCWYMAVSQAERIVTMKGINQVGYHRSIPLMLASPSNTGGSFPDAKEHQGEIPCAKGRCHQDESVGSSPTHRFQNPFLELRESLFAPSITLLENNPVTHPLSKLYL